MFVAVAYLAVILAIPQGAFAWGREPHQCLARFHLRLAIRDPSPGPLRGPPSPARGEGCKGLAYTLIPPSPRGEGGRQRRPGEGSCRRNGFGRLDSNSRVPNIKSTSPSGKRDPALWQRRPSGHPPVLAPWPSGDREDPEVRKPECAGGVRPHTRCRSRGSGAATWRPW